MPSPYQNAPCLYVAQFKSGVIKIGCSGNANHRMETLRNTCKAKGMGEVSRVHIEYVAVTRLGRPIDAERHALVRARRLAVQRGNTKEFFLGLRFGEAKNIVRQASREFRMHLTPADAMAEHERRHAAFLKTYRPRKPRKLIDAVKVMEQPAKRRPAKTAAPALAAVEGS